MAQMASASNYISGTITLNSDQTTIQISVPFEPKLFIVHATNVTTSSGSYVQIASVGGKFGVPLNGYLPTAETQNGGVNQCYEMATNGNTRNAGIPQPSYSDGVATFSTRSSSFSWAAGTYEYIIAG